MPVKYREMHDFHEYYSGKRVAPYLTIFVGGNHEASNYLSELYYGGWVAPNIYYAGAANVLSIGGLRIAGLSGIWKGYNYKKPHYERLPYSDNDVKSVYHVRELDVRKLLQVRTQIDIGISHDWPRGVEWQGDWKKLFRQKSHFEEDARNGQLGSVAAKYVMDRLRPPYWFSAHLHCKFSAIVHHSDKADAVAAPPQQSQPNGHVEAQQDDNEIDLVDDIKEPEPKTTVVTANVDEIDLELEEEEDAPGSAAVVAPGQGLDGVVVERDEKANGQASLISEEVRQQLPASFHRPPPRSRPEAPASTPIPAGIVNETTHFLALDKCLPNRSFLQLLSVVPRGDSQTPLSRPLALEYDKEWLAITRVFGADLTFGDASASVPVDEGFTHYSTLVEEQEAWVEENVAKKGRMQVPNNFEVTAPVYDESMGLTAQEPPKEHTNLQTSAYCELLGIANPFDMSEEERAKRMADGPAEAPRDQYSGGRGDFGRGRGRGRGRGFGGSRGGRGGRGFRNRGGRW